MSMKPGVWPSSRSASTRSSAADAAATRSPASYPSRWKWTPAIEIARPPRPARPIASWWLRPNRVGGRPDAWTGREPECHRRRLAGQRGELGQLLVLILVVDHNGHAALRRRPRAVPPVSPPPSRSRPPPARPGRAPGGAPPRSRHRRPTRAALPRRPERGICSPSARRRSCRSMPCRPPTSRSSAAFLRRGRGSRMLSGDPWRSSQSRTHGGAPAQLELPRLQASGERHHAGTARSRLRRSSRHVLVRDRRGRPAVPSPQDAACPAVRLRVERATERVVADHRVLGGPADRREARRRRSPPAGRSRRPPSPRGRGRPSTSRACPSRTSCSRSGLRRPSAPGGGSTASTTASTRPSRGSRRWRRFRRAGVDQREDLGGVDGRRPERDALQLGGEAAKPARLTAQSTCAR